MNSHGGKVVDVDAVQRIVTVRPDQPIACARCAAGRGCGAGLTTVKTNDFELRLDAGEALPMAGDRITLQLERGKLLRAAAIVYGWPLCGAIGMAVLASALSPSDAIVALFALAGLSAGFFLARRHSATRCLMPTIRSL